MLHCKAVLSSSRSFEPSTYTVIAAFPPESATRAAFAVFLVATPNVCPVSHGAGIMVEIGVCEPCAVGRGMKSLMDALRVIAGVNLVCCTCLQAI